MAHVAAPQRAFPAAGGRASGVSRSSLLLSPFILAMAWAAHTSAGAAEGGEGRGEGTALSRGQESSLTAWLPYHHRQHHHSSSRERRGRSTIVAYHKHKLQTSVEIPQPQRRAVNLLGARPVARTAAGTPRQWQPQSARPRPAVTGSAAAAENSTSRCFLGVNYGRHLSSNPVPVPQAIRIIRQEMGAAGIKIWAPDFEVYKHVAGTGIAVMVGLYPFNETNKFAKNDSAAQAWVDTFIAPFHPQVNFVGIFVANEVIDVDVSADSLNVVPAMWALYRALRRRNLHRKVKVHSPMRAGFADTNIPPSRSACPKKLAPVLRSLLSFLNQTDSRFIVTAYPFYSVKDVKPTPSTSFAFFRGTDGYYDKGGLYYQNLFDAFLDSVYWVMEQLGYPNIEIEVGETGWPTAGIAATSYGHPSGLVAAALWNRALLGKVCSGQGTPKRPGQNIRVWLFEAFDEDGKYRADRPWEGHWGLRFQDGRPKFPFSLQPNMIHNFAAPPTLPPAKWCVVKNDSGSDNIQANVEWACSRDGGRVDCSRISGHCDGDTYSSAVYNAYFQLNRQGRGTCNFNGTAEIVQGAIPEGLTGSHCPFPGRPWV